MKEHEQNKFICHNCGWIPSADMSAEDLDHCPNCLSGIHKEDEDGYECGGIFEAVGIWVKAENEWNIIQRCSFCGEMRLAPMAEYDSRIKILSIASKPMASPPFPVDKLEELTKMMGGQGNLNR